MPRLNNALLACERNMGKFRVWKFGGSSLANGERIDQVSDLILTHGINAKTEDESNNTCSATDYIRGDDKDNLIVVVSAIAGVTNLLHKACTIPDDKSSCRTLVFKKLSILDEVVIKHQLLIGELLQRNCLSDAEAEQIETQIKSDCYTKIRSLLDACSIIGNIPMKIAEIVKGFGEIWSCVIITMVTRHKMYRAIEKSGEEQLLPPHLKAEEERVQTKWYSVESIEIADSLKLEGTDSLPILGLNCTILERPWNCQELIQLRKPVLADETPMVDMDMSKKLLLSHVSKLSEASEIVRTELADYRTVEEDTVMMRMIAFATGYVCKDHEGASATLGRNGSDYSGAIIANCLNAKSYTIWSDVEGVFTADPRIISAARCVPVLTYEEAMELSYFGASVIHPLTMQPLISADIPIFMKSSYTPGRCGTVICRKGRTLECLEKESSRLCLDLTPPWKTVDEITLHGIRIGDLACKSITTIGGVSMLTMLGAVVSSKRGISTRVFITLDDMNIQVMMVCQASSQYCVSIGIKSMDVAKAVEGLEKEFFSEIARSNSFKIKVTSDLAVLCTVGEGQRDKVGYITTVTSAIAETGTSIVACVQSPSERLIAFAIHESDREKCVKRLHISLFPHLKESQVLPEANIKSK